DARPHALSRDRRAALHDHAGALRLLLVRAAGARQVGTGETARGAGVRDAGGAAQLDLGVAGADTWGRRTRRAARTSGADALVSGAHAGKNQADAGVGDPLLRYRRQPAVARVFPSHTVWRDLA